MARALITGVSGQNGWDLAQQLHAAGVAVRGSSRSGGLPLDLPFVHPTSAADLGDGPRLERAVAAARPNRLYHLAARTSVAASWDDPAATGDATGLGIARLLEAVRRAASAARVVVASSSEAFGQPDRAPRTSRPRSVPSPPTAPPRPTPTTWPTPSRLTSSSPPGRSGP